MTMREIDKEFIDFLKNHADNPLNTAIRDDKIGRLRRHKSEYCQKEFLKVYKFDVKLIDLGKF